MPEQVLKPQEATKFEPKRGSESKTDEEIVTHFRCVSSAKAIVPGLGCVRVCTYVCARLSAVQIRPHLGRTKTEIKFFSRSTAVTRRGQRLAPVSEAAGHGRGGKMDQETRQDWRGKWHHSVRQDLVRGGLQKKPLQRKFSGFFQSSFFCCYSFHEDHK